MSKLFKWLTQRSVLIFIGLCLLALVVWFVGPRWPIFESAHGGYVRPLAPPVPRLVAIAAIFAVWLLVLLIRLLRNTLAAARLKQDIVASEPSQAEHQIGQLETAFSQAVEALERHRGSKGKRSLAELPWYMVLGPSGVGKTELLRTSGVDFPYESDASKKYVDGAGGTLNCKWWLGREAILLDTAGRYIRQDQHSEADRAEWERFLALLRKHRRRQPLNGLIAVISADDVLQEYAGSAEAMRAEADRLRSRIKELNSAFNLSLPVYLIVSKTDLVAGFSEYFRDLNSEELRAQVWGFDLAAGDGSMSSLRERLQSGFTRLTHRLRDRALHRLADVTSLRQSIPVQSFAWQLANLTDPLGEFLELAFGPDQMGEDLWLRGVYLTSATQSGSPIDQLTTELSQVFGIAEVEQSQIGGVGMSYFVRDLLTRKIFPEQQLAGESGRFRNASSWALRGACAAGLLAAVVCTWVWANGLRDSQAALREADQLIADATLALPKTAEPQAILDYLQQLKGLREATQIRFAMLDTTRHLALSAVPEVNHKAHELYTDGLRDYFVPYLAAWLYEELRTMRGLDAFESPTPWQNTYDEFVLLEYLSAFGDSGKLNEEPRKTQLLDWFAAVFQQEFRADGDLVDQLTEYLNFYRTADLPTIDFSADAVVESRQSFADRDKARLIYELLLGALGSEIARDINLLNSPNEALFSTVFEWDGDGSQLVIPGIFTQNGLEALLEQGQLTGFVRQYQQRAWVLGEKYKLPYTSALVGEIRRLYVQDYVRIWNRAISSLRVRSSANASQRAVISTFVGPRSPVRELLKRVYEQTRLEQASAQKPSAGKSVLKRAASKTKVGRVAGRLGAGRSSGSQLTPRGTITEAFEDLNTLSDGGAGLTPLDTSLTTVANILRLFDEPDQRQRVIGDINVECEQQPEPVRTWICALVSASSTAVENEFQLQAATDRAQVRTDSEKQVADVYLADVWPQCSSEIHGRFPADPNSREDISLEDLDRVFGAGSLLDGFTNSTLSAHLDRTRRPWRWLKTEDKDPLNLSAELPRAMQRAADIRRAFDLPLTLGLDPGEVDPRITTLILTIDGQRFEYRQGPQQTTRITWPDASSASGVQLVIQIAGESEKRRQWSGPWALLRALNDATVEKGSARGILLVTFNLDGYVIPIQINTNRATNPLLTNPLEGFQCPAL